MKKRKIILFLMLTALLFSFGCGKKETVTTVTESKSVVQTEEVKDKPVEKVQEAEGETDKYLTDPVPEGKPVPVEPQEAVVEKEVLECTISISCATILNNMDQLDPAKTGLVPADGWILKAKKVTVRKGESVFDVLQRVCREEKIHMEYMDTPIYNSAYIEGIHNLYEFDAGPLSGWMYRVNGWFPNYGCSRYQLQNGDVIEWVYTCDLGSDVGRSVDG